MFVERERSSDQYFNHAQAHKIEVKTSENSNIQNYSWISDNQSESTVGKICRWILNSGFNFGVGLYNIVRNSLCPRMRSTKTEKQLVSILKSESNFKSLEEKKVQFNLNPTIQEFIPEVPAKRRIASNREAFNKPTSTKIFKKRYDITAYTSSEKT